MTRLLDIRNLTIGLPPGGDRPHAVEDLSMSVEAGEIVCLVGASGSGKSLTAQAVMRLLPPALRTAGHIAFHGRDMLGLQGAELRRVRGPGMGMVFQEPMTALNPLMRVGEQVAEALRFHGHDRCSAARESERLLAAMGLPDPEATARQWPFRLSGGQRQRVMIAMAVALRPSLLIADEPTTALDVTTQAQILALIRDLQRQAGMGVLFVTHDFGVVSEIADRVVVLEAGRIVESGSAHTLLRAPAHPYTARLIAAVPVGRQSSRPAPTERAAEISGLTHLFRRDGDSTPARGVRDVSFDVGRGEILGLVGESGSGKTTIGRCIVGLERPTAGMVKIHAGNKGASRRARRAQMVFQDPYGSLNPRRTIGAILVDAGRVAGLSPADAATKARAQLALVDVPVEALGRYAHEFSGGQRQRIAIARALMSDPVLLVADEPVSALDVLVQDQVLLLFERLRAEAGLSVLFVTHDLRVAARLCDRIAVLDGGHIVEIGPTAEVLQNASHPTTQALLRSLPGTAWRPLYSPSPVSPSHPGGSPP
jgi:peptide/nickel transport system ATP-binding protein